ncbi:hypothetical protein F183_A37570 [Bryobacterales bacterium F-183]|nr:hypothetical protein F183_A37570 [Bryobacterales bacterium F-183]
MRSVFLRTLIILGGLAAASVPACADTVLNFDDLTTLYAPVGTYQGVVFDASWNYFDFPDPQYPASSPSTRLGVNKLFGGDAEFTFASPVIFKGAFFSGLTGEKVSFELYNGGLVHTSGILAVSDVPTFLSSGYTGLVSKVRVRNTADPIFAQFVMDDVTFQQVTTGVPEPSAVVLMSGVAGLLVLGGRRQRLTT